MQSFSSLNSFANQSLTVTDNRGSGVVFDRVRANGVPLEVTTSSVTINSYGTQIQEIINYSTANVRFRIELKKGVGSGMTASVAFGGLPSGVTLTTTSTTWLLTGLKSKADWDAVKTTVWTLNAGFASYNYWYFEYRITYYDSDLGEDVSVTWDVYDPDKYPISFVTSAATLTCRGDRVVRSAVGTPVGSPVTSYIPKNLRGAFTVATAANLSGRLASSSVSSAFTMPNLATFRAKLFQAQPVLNFALGSNIIYSKTSRAQAALAAAFTIPLARLRYVVRLISRAEWQANFIGGFPYEGTSGPGGVPYLEGNGFAYYNIDGSLSGNGMPIGLTRIRQGAATLSSAFSTTCIGADARLVSAMVMSAGTLTADIKKYKGPSPTGLSAQATVSSQPVKTVSGRSEITGAATFTGTPKAIKVFASNISMAASQSGTITKIKQLASTISSALTSSVSTNNSRIRFLATTTHSMASSLSATPTAYGPMILNYTITSTTMDSGAANTIYLPLGGTVNLTVDWGDGTTEDFTTAGMKSHAYSSTGNKTITLKPRVFNNTPALTSFGAIPYDAGYTGPGARTKPPSGSSVSPILAENDFILSPSRHWFKGVTRFGELGLASVPYIFYTIAVGGSGTESAVTTIPSSIPSSITDLSYAYLPNLANVSSWDVQYVTKAKKMVVFDFTQSISAWNTVGFTDMSYMFYECNAFRQITPDSLAWNTSNVTNMSYMFYWATQFTGNIATWNTGNVTNMSYMFYNADNMQSFIGVWNVSNVTNMEGMFMISNFLRPIGAWNVSSVTNMNYMFSGNVVFDQNISTWCVSLIPTKPTGFDTGTTSAWTIGEKPVWGTCP